MKYSLNTTIIEPETKNEINNAIILLHGYGGDGKDISALSYNWKRFLKNSIFLCPDGHEKCSINPNGFQWFDLTREDPNYILEQTLIAEKKINHFIEEIKEEYKLSNSRICISGFSQGCMMAINVGLTANDKFGCIVGFSGKIINQENLSKRIKSKTKLLLFHGDADQVVPPSSLLEAKDFFIRHKIEANTKIIKNCDHHISIEASSDAMNFIRQNMSF